MSRATRLLSSAFALVLMHLPATASACAACMGNPNTKVAGAINGAIFLLLGFIVTVLGSLAGFALYLMKRSGATGSQSGFDSSDFDEEHDT